MRTVSRRTQFLSSALPPKGTLKASPRAISRRTSYHRVRLEFLSYPQLISACCTAREFGPPPVFLQGSSWPWIAHPVSGRVYATYSPVKTRFRYAFAPEGLKLATHTHSQAHSSIGIPSPLARLWLFVSIRFQILFHRPPGLLFTFPSWYLSTIDH